MPGIIAAALIAAVVILTFAVRFLLSAWLLAATAVLAWIRFRPLSSYR